MILPALTPIPGHLHKHFLVLRLFLYGTILTITVLFVLRVLFPIIDQSFDFRAPNSSRNTIVDPRTQTDTPRTNGKIEAGGTLIANTAVAGDFSLARVTATLEKKSAVPEQMAFSLRRSYRDFLFPTGQEMNHFPEAALYTKDGTYYALKDDTFYPFVSERAYLSRYPQELALPLDQETLAKYPVSSTWLGFRVGALLSDASGVFIVVSEEEMRPVGSADIFLQLGYSFDDVIAANEEELGVYRRGRIVVLGTPHPDGTVFLDQDTKSYFIIEGATKRPLSGIYRDFLLKETHPIIASSQASTISASCTLMPTLFGGSFTCNVPIAILQKGFGNDFELRINNLDTDIDINALTVSFETSRSDQNMLTLLSQVKQRILSRFGYGNAQ